VGHTYTSPLVQVVPPFFPDTEGQALRLFRHYAVQYRAVNTYVLSDETVSTDYPIPLAGDILSTVTIPLPWDPTQMGTDPTNPATGGEVGPLRYWGPGSEKFDESPPFVWIYDVLDPTEQVRTSSTSPYLVSMFRGGPAPYPISDAMYTLLHAAGYTAYLT
jgi:hypothetical protein